MKLEDAIVARLKASHSKGLTPPRAITGVLNQTVFPSLEKPRAKPIPPLPNMPFSPVAAPPVASPETVPVESEATFDAFDAYARNSQGGW